jgi:hypothetical protein
MGFVILLSRNDGSRTSIPGVVSDIHQTLDYNHHNILTTNVILRLYQNKSHSLKYHHHVLCRRFKKPAGSNSTKVFCVWKSCSDVSYEHSASAFRVELAMYSCK